LWQPINKWTRQAEILARLDKDQVKLSEPYLHGQFAYAKTAATATIFL
jgi:hypothetical protein